VVGREVVDEVDQITLEIVGVTEKDEFHVVSQR
jgi:hypothetical protein